ncbi:MAG: adenine nucleotide alpha hydrolase [Solirubrobacterales bacterium]|nr:adenine nucleotide alpha hydrolase [Solirubrobacterales bacterium]
MALSWSGGKDSALALWMLGREYGIVPRALITTVTDAYDRVSMHGVRRSLIALQASAVGVPLVEIEIPVGCTNDVYEQRMTEALAAEPLRSVEAVAFGDLFLEDIRSYREGRLATVGKAGCFPLWHRDTTRLAHEFVAAGFEASIVCLDPAKLDRSFAGRRFDDRLLADLPAGVDPCGENGEFHTFVYAGPVMAAPIDVRVGETVERDGFVFTDLIGHPIAPRGRIA